jgi:hypothetical protein
MTEQERHHLSRPLRTMHGLVNRKTLDDAADELDRLNALIAGMVSARAAEHATLRRTIRELEDRVQVLPPPQVTVPAADEEIAHLNAVIADLVTASAAEHAALRRTIRELEDKISEMSPILETPPN